MRAFMHACMHVCHPRPSGSPSIGLGLCVPVLLRYWLRDRSPAAALGDMAADALSTMSRTSFCSMFACSYMSASRIAIARMRADGCGQADRMHGLIYRAHGTYKTLQILRCSSLDTLRGRRISSSLSLSLSLSLFLSLQC